MTRELVLSVSIKDCDVSTFSPSGAGGQHKDHGQSGVRVRHAPSGAVGTASDSRSGQQNRRNAFLRMQASKQFRDWVKRQAGEDALLIAAVERETWSDRTLVEVRDEHGEWVKA